MLSQQGLPSHHTSELRGRIAAPPLLRSWDLYPLYGHCGTGGGAQDRSGTTVRGLAPGSFGNHKGAWHTAQDTGAVRQSMCLEKKKKGSPKMEASGVTEGKFKAGIGVLDPEITSFPLSWIPTFHFQRERGRERGYISVDRCMCVYTYTGKCVPVSTCVWKTQDKDQVIRSHSPCILRQGLSLAGACQVGNE